MLPWEPHSPKTSSRPPSTTAPNQDSTWTEVITRTRKTNNTIPWNPAGPTSTSTPSNPLLRSEILAGSGTDPSNGASTVRLALSNRFAALMHPPKPDSTSPNQPPLRGDVAAYSTSAAGAPMAPTRPPGGAPGPSFSSTDVSAVCWPDDLLATSSRASPGAGGKNTSLPACRGIPEWPGTGGRDPSPSVPGRARSPRNRLDHRSESRTASSAARRRFLQEAVRRNSAGPATAAPDRNGRPSPLPQASTAPLIPRSPAISSTSSSGAMQPPPLFPPTTLIVGDSITRGIRFFNAITRSFPSATVVDITSKLPGLLQSLPPSIHRIIVHIGTNDTAHKQSELTKRDFKSLLHILQCSGKSVFISGPLPTLTHSIDRFSRLLSLNSWLRSFCSTSSTHFIDNFNLFWNRSPFFSHDGLHPNKLGYYTLTANIQHHIHTN
ncbi:hypothetical protein D4764_12G0010930 [Xyrichtys novacula]|uniref:SGNH hydrolase-type esterase domain-containing protein n=1 Tax=Xyrichtys novacula TaxID=13765 RepID=A0AAV1H564_XYRNO|nr:hypothetical protein D4764_12G0010930 [Xyrichtys novacula]